MGKSIKKTVEMPVSTPQPAGMQKKKVKRTLEDTPTLISSKKAKTTEQENTTMKREEDKKNPIMIKKVKELAKPVAKAAITKVGKSGPPAKVPAKVESESEDNDSEDESNEEDPVPVQKTFASKASAKANIRAKVAKKVESSSDESVEEENESDESDEEVDATKEKASIVEDESEPELSAEVDESDDDEEESDEEAHVKNQKVSMTKKPVQAQEESDSDDSEEEEDDDEDTIVQRSKAPSGTVDEDSDASAESDESDEEEQSEEEKTITKKQKVEIHTPGKVGGDSTGTQTIHIRNLAWAVTEDNIREFFGKDVAEVRLATDDTGRIKGFGHVEFKNEAAAKKAVGKSGQELLGREIFCDLARERGAQSAGKRDWKSPQSGGNNTNGTPGGSRPTGTDKTAFVKGFDKFQDEDTIRSGLGEFFEECGEVSNIRIPIDRETGQSKGFAYVEFASNDAFSKAMELNGEELNGRYLVVNEASQPSGDSGRGRGRGGGGRGFGGRGGRGGFGGRDRGRGGFGGRDRGRGGRGGFGGGRGSRPNFGGSASGKKTKFAD
ncbi:hypothetical protein O6H91_Y151200 [Diphasiastrum complanatum]|nr:hypothetical protein O6H91_Y151200 [Diphasiastrum complanatum]KAJ7295985.1 hypothetical protein O6H91_Y151200 [Diphasiastrum complanatum]